MRRGGPAGRAGLALCAVLLPLLSGCGLTHVQDLNFRVDDRLHFTSPADRALVGRPLTVTWTMDDFRIAASGSEPPSEDAGYFLVFVDREPIKPGQSIDAIASGDQFCQQDPKCPDTAYLRDRNVFPTTSTHLRLKQITNIQGSREDIQLHTITVVLMDTADRRIRESAWELDVRMHKVGL